MPKIGDALKKAMEIKPQEEIVQSRARASSALMNLNRRKIFQYLCNNPCSGIGSISESLKLSSSTVSWHIEYLVKSGYLDYKSTGKKKVYCPVSLLSSKNMLIFSFLSHPVNLKLYREILNNPGQSRAMLSEKISISNSHVSEILGDMLDMQLITSVKDGKYVRFFPTDNFTEIIKEGSVSHKAFIRLLIKKMNSEHLRPEVNELKSGNIIIHIKVPGQIARIEIPSNHFENLILKI